MAKMTMVRPNSEQNDTASASTANGAAPGALAQNSTSARRRWAVRYPNAYAWFVFLAALDIMLTYLILHPVLFASDATMTESRGTEENVVAGWVIEQWDVPGMVGFKFALVIVVIILCEVIGRHRDSTGRRLAEWAVAVTVIPVLVALTQMGMDLYFWFYPAH
jgi:hypothetical protein